MSTVFAVILAAGSSERFGSPKMLADIQGHPLISLSVTPFVGLCDKIVIVLPQETKISENIKEALAYFPSLIYVSGGSTRQESVQKAISSLTALPDDIVLIHDGARPLVSSRLITRVLSNLCENSSLLGVVPLLESVDTLYRFSDNASPHLEEREKIKSVQTPQAFRFQPLQERLSSPSSFPDEGSLFLSSSALGFVRGEECNIKVTTPYDHGTVSQLLVPRITHKSSSGYDVHRLSVGDGVILGGVKIKSPYALFGHSDADVLLHSLTDAIYGLTASGDIGIHFPPSDLQWKGASSSLFLRHALSTLTTKGGRLSHIDMTLIAETPKISPHALSIRTSLSRLCSLPLSSVSLKATTTEGLGFVGRKEGIACLAHASASFLAPS